MKMTMEDRNTALEIINRLLEAGLATKYFDKEEPYLSTWFYKTFGYGNSLTFADGASKAVFINSNFEWVIKINLPREEHNWCGREYENYRLAEEYGLTYYFASCEYLGEFEGIEFYAQEYVDCNEEVDSEIYNSLKHRYDSSNMKYDEDCLWDELDNLEADERVDLLYNDEELVCFILERHINDLHCGNFGIKGDHYVIIDYCGFGDFIFEEE